MPRCTIPGNPYTRLMRTAKGLAYFRRLPALATAHGPDRRIVEVTADFARRLGFEADALIGKSTIDLVTRPSASLIEEEYLPILRRTGKLDVVPVEFVDSDGQPVPLLVRTAAGASPADATLTVYLEAEETLRLGRRFQNLFRATPSMLHVTDAHGRILEVSDRWLRKLDYRRDEVVGRNILDFLTASDVDSLTEGRLPLLIESAEQTNLPRQMVTRSGAVIDVLMSASIEKDDEDQAVLLYVASKDVTEASTPNTAKVA